MEFSILDSGISASVAEKGKKPCPWAGGVSRRKLADISNLMEKPRTSNQDKFQSAPSRTKEYIDQLHNENMALVKMLAHRDKIIEQSGVEIEALRVNLLKMREQNRQLALSNTQMLRELNLGKEQLKALEHELGCKNGLLISRKLEVEGSVAMRSCENADVEVKSINCEKPEVSSKEAVNDENPCSARSLQANSEENFMDCLFIFERADIYFTQNVFIWGAFVGLGSSKQFISMDKAESRRSRVRRQSARFKAEEVKPIDNQSGDDGKSLTCPLPQDPFTCPLPQDPVKENVTTSINAPLETDGKKCSAALGPEARETGRFSLCRPSRQAAKKVTSYKEIPINVKMRRPA